MTSKNSIYFLQTIDVIVTAYDLIESPMSKAIFGNSVFILSELRKQVSEEAMTLNH